MTIDFAQMCSTEDQRPNVTTPIAIALNQNDAISGIEHSSEQPTNIKIFEPGIYVVIVAPQVGRTSGTEERYVDVWLRKNGVDIPNSNVRCVLRGSRDKDVVVCQTMMPFNKDDRINVMMSVEVPDEGLGIEAIHPNGEPLIPSVILSMHKIKEHATGHYVTRGGGRGISLAWIEE